MAEHVHTSMQTPEGEGIAVKRSDGRWAWVVLILLPTSAWMVVLVLVLTYQPQPVRTGDTLYDRYLAVLAASPRVGSGGVFNPRGSHDYNPAALSDEVFTAWEPDFGDDPRFWMLRYQLTRDVPEEYRGKYSVLGVRPEVYYLEEARRRGVADGAILLKLLRQYDSAWHSEIEHLVTTQRTSRNDPMDVQLARVQATLSQRRGLIDERHGDEHSHLLDELFAAAPGEAVPFYYAAQIATERGDLATALEHLAQGNRAPLKSIMMGFPIEKYIQDIRDGRSLPDKLVSGAISVQLVSHALPNLLRTKWMMKLLVQDAVEHQDLAALDELHTFACHYRNAEGQSCLQSMVSLGMVGTVYNGATKNWSLSHDPGQSKALGELDAKYSQLRIGLMAISQHSYAMPGFTNLPPMQSLLFNAEGLLCGGRNAAIYMSEYWHDETVVEQTALGGRIDLLFEEIERFDYNTLSWEQ